MKEKQQSRWGDLVRPKAIRKKSGFTLVELIVTMAIIGVLILLAAPKFIGWTEESRRTNIVNDIAVAEHKVSEYLIEHDTFDSEWTPVILAHMHTQKEKGVLYDREGLVAPDIGVIQAGDYVLLPDTFIKEEVHSKLEGEFYANGSGDVYYGDAERDDEDDAPSDIKIPDNYVLATDDDFIWIDTKANDQWTLIYEIQDELRIAEYGSVDNYYKYLYSTLPNEMTASGHSSDDISKAQADLEQSIKDRATAKLDSMDVGYFYYKGSAEYVIIPDTIKGKAVTSTKKMFGSVYVPEYGYLKSTVKGVAANNPAITDMQSMFEDSYSESLELLYLNTSNVTNMSEMFDYSAATTLDLSSFDTSNVTNMSGMFSDSKATTFDLSSFDTSSVTDMSEMFSDNQATTLDLSSFDTSSVTDMNSMFEDAVATTLDLSSFDITNVEDMDYMFDNAAATTGYARTQEEADRYNDDDVTDIPDYLYFIVKGSGTKTPAQIDEEFRNSLPDEYVLADDDDFERFYSSSAPTKYIIRYVGTDEYVIIPRSIKIGWSTYKLTDYYSMFYGTSVKGVASNNSNVTNVSDMFGFSAATTIDLRYLDTSNVTNMSEMFKYSQTATIDLSSLNTSKVTDMSRMFEYSKITTIDLSSLDTSSVTDASQMFKNSQATTIDLSSLDMSKVTDMSQMFYNSQATTIDLSLIKTSNVTDMSNMFYHSQAKTLDLSSLDTSKVTTMNQMFKVAEATTLDLSSFDTSNVTDMWGMFWRSSATTIKLSSFNTSKVTTMNQMFYDSEATTLDLSSFNTSNVTDMYEMFSYSNATTIDVSSFDVSKAVEMGSMFSWAKVSTLDLSSFDLSHGQHFSTFFFLSEVRSGYARTSADAAILNSFNLNYNDGVHAKFIVK